MIATMVDQKDVVSGKADMGGTMRLGLYKADLLAGSVVAIAMMEWPASEIALAMARPTGPAPMTATFRRLLIFTLIAWKLADLFNHKAND